MGKLLVVYDKEKKARYNELIRAVKEIWQAKYSAKKPNDEPLEIEEVVIEKGTITHAIIRQLHGEDVEYIFSVDMAGFEAGTLLGSYTYNILRVKQLHMVVERRCLDTYAHKDMALNLFFYVTGESGALQEVYEHILNIEGLPKVDWRSAEGVEQNRALIEQMIDTVME